MVKDKEPYYYSKTIRQALFEELLEGSRTVRELSQAIRIPEKEVITHLTYVKQSALNKGYRFIIKPSECLNCGFIFDKRDKPKKPGRCPRCKEEHLTNPSFGLEKLHGF
ncbi:MAG: transcriptional regulator [Thermodesulfobacteriota bacterium]